MLLTTKDSHLTDGEIENHVKTAKESVMKACSNLSTLQNVKTTEKSATKALFELANTANNQARLNEKTYPGSYQPCDNCRQAETVCVFSSSNTNSCERCASIPGLVCLSSQSTPGLVCRFEPSVQTKRAHHFPDSAEPTAIDFKTGSVREIDSGKLVISYVQRPAAPA